MMPFDLGLNPQIDNSVWNNTKLLREGIELAFGANEFAQCVQVRGKPTNSPAAYEKAGILIQVHQEDPSDYSTGKTRDLCDIRAAVSANDSRAWALALAVECPVGLDGMVTACEVGGDNFGSYQPDPDTKTSKYGFQWIGGYYPGNNPLTATNYYERGTCGHHRMNVMREDAFAGKPGDSFVSILYANTNTVKHELGPNGYVVDGRKVVVRRISGYDCLVLE